MCSNGDEAEIFFKVIYRATLCCLLSTQDLVRSPSQDVIITAIILRIVLSIKPFEDQW